MMVIRKVIFVAICTCFAAGCGSPAEDPADAAGDAEAAQSTEAVQSLEALDRAAAVQQTLDEAEKKRREAIEEQGD